MIEESPEEKEIPKRKVQTWEEKGRPKSTEVTVTQHEVKEQEKDRPRYFPNLDVGRIVIEEIPEERKEERRVSKKEEVKPRSMEVISTSQRFDEFPGESIKQDVVKVGKLDVADVEKHSVEYRTVKERTRRYKDWTHKKHEPEEKQLIAIDDVSKTDEPEKPRHPKDLDDIGRIVIEEISHEMKERPRVPEKERPKSVEVTLTARQVKDQVKDQSKITSSIKAGKIDVCNLEKQFVNSETLKERIRSCTEKKPVYATIETATICELKRIGEPEKPRYPNDLDIGRIVIEEIADEKEEVHKRDVLRKKQLESNTTEVTVTRHEAKEQREARLRCSKDLNIGRTVIDEIPEEKKTIPRAPKKEKTRPKSIEVTLTDQEVKEIPRERTKENVINVGKLDVTDYEKQIGQSRTVQEITRIYKDWTHQHETKAQVKIATEDVKRTEKLEKPRYFKDLNVGRIVIEESTKDKEEMPRVPKKEKIRPKSIEVTGTGKDFEEIPGEYVKEDAVKVGKLDVTDFEQQSVESRTTEKRIRRYKEKTHIAIDEFPEDKQEIHKQEQIGQKTTDVIDTQYEVEEQREERPRYVKNRDVGHIIIEEIPEEKKEKPRSPKIVKLRPKTIEVTLTDQDFDDIPSKYVKEDVLKIGKLDIPEADFEKQSVESRTVEERIGSNKDWTQKPETKEKLRVATSDTIQTIETEPEKPRYPKDVDIGRIVIQEIPEENKDISKRYVLRKEQLRPKSTEVTITQHEFEKQREERPRYLKDLDVGRIVIDEIPEVKVIPRVPKRENVIPKSIEVTLSGQECEEIPGEYITDAGKVEKLDVTGFEKEFVESTTVKERIRNYKDKTHKSETVEKVTITSDVVEQTKELEKPRYFNDLDIGRIVIKDIPEEKEVRKEHVRPRSTEVTFKQYEAEEHPETYVTENVIKVGKLDLPHLVKETVGTETVEERIQIYKDTVDGIPKVFFLFSSVIEFV